MKKLLIFVMALTILPFATSCGPSKTELAEKARQDSIRVADSIRQVEEKAKADSISQAKAKAEADSIARDQRVIAFITDMYNSAKYENYTWLRRHCTQKVLDKLAGDYDYDGEGFAVWDFRSDSQDGAGNYKIVQVKPVGQGWYLYSFHDGDVSASHKVLVIDDGESFKIDGLERFSR